MNDDKQLQEVQLEDHSKPIEHKPDPLTIEEAMKCWRKYSGDAIALARTLTVAGSTPAEQAALFLNAANMAAGKIIIDEFARLYQVERNYETLKTELEASNKLLVRAREELDKHEGKAKKPSSRRHKA